MRYETSTLKTAEQGFNNLGDRKEVEGLLKHFPITFVDCESEYYQNREDTMVFVVEEAEQDLFLVGLDIGRLAIHLRADEFSYVKGNDGQVVIRFWWD